MPSFAKETAAKIYKYIRLHPHCRRMKIEMDLEILSRDFTEAAKKYLRKKIIITRNGVHWYYDVAEAEVRA